MDSQPLRRAVAVSRSPARELHERPHYLTSFTSRLASRCRVAIARRSSIISALYRPWIVRAALIRSSPSAVLGPVLAPLWIRHRPFGIAGDRHEPALRVGRLTDHGAVTQLRLTGKREQMTRDNEKPSIILDLRCLQDPSYSTRGVGRHALAILRHAPRDWHIAGLTDPSLPTLLPEAREAVETVHINAYAASGAGTPLRPPVCFVMLSPMTHDPLFSARLLTNPTMLRATIV